MKFPQRLTDVSGKFYEFDVVGSTLTTRSGKAGGKVRVSEKTFDVPSSARLAARKKIDAQLKKGLVFRDLDPRPGDSLLRSRHGGAYTGALTMTLYGEHIAFVQPSVAGNAELRMMDEGGVLSTLRELPEASPNQLQYVESVGAFYCRGDAGLIRITSNEYAVDVMAYESRIRDLHCANGLAAVTTDDGSDTWSASVIDLASGAVLCRDVPAYAARLSHDGTRLATSYAGSVSIHDVNTGAVVTSFKRFEGLRVLDFHPNQPVVLCCEPNGSCRLSVYDYEADEDRTMHYIVERGSADPMPAEDRRMVLGVTGGVFSPDGTTLALSRGPFFDFYAVETGRRTRQVQAWCGSRFANLLFHGNDQLVVRTKAGLFERFRVQ